MRVVLLFGPLAPRLAASAVAHWGDSQVSWPLVLRLLASAELCSTGPASPAWSSRESSDLSGFDQGDPYNQFEGGVWRGGQCMPSQNRPCLMTGIAVVKTPQQWRKQEQGMLPTHSRCDATKSAATRVRTLCAYVKTFVHRICMTHMYCIPMNDCCITFRTINHVVLHYIHHKNISQSEKEYQTVVFIEY